MNGCWDRVWAPTPQSRLHRLLFLPLLRVPRSRPLCVVRQFHFGLDLGHSLGAEPGQRANQDRRPVVSGHRRENA